MNKKEILKGQSEEVPTGHRSLLSERLRDRLKQDSNSDQFGVLLELGTKLKEIRRRLGVTQEELAQKIRKKRTFISRIEKGKSNITLNTLYEIAQEGLGVRLRIDIDEDNNENSEINDHET